MNRDLKACPLCGSKAELKESHYLESERPYSYVRCTNDECSLHQNTAHFSGGGAGANSRAAVEAWNREEVLLPDH